MSKASTKISRSFLFGRFTSEFRGEVSLSKSAAGTFVHNFVHTVLPQTLLNKGAIEDLKGRDPGRRVGGRFVSADSISQVHEIAAIRGKIFIEESLRDTESFELKLLTPFDSFKESSHIIHKVERARLGFAPEELQIESVGRAVPVELTEFRFGIDLFAPRRVMMMGVNPEALESLLLEWDGEDLKFEITAENLASRDSLPLSRYEIFAKLSLLWQELFEQSLTDLYKSSTVR